MTVTVKAATARTCPVCAARYGAVVDIGCRMCGGIGTVVVTAAEVDLPATCHAVGLFALRPDRPAVTAGTAAEYDRSVAVDRRSLVAAGLVSGPTHAARPPTRSPPAAGPSLALPPTGSATSAKPSLP